MDTDDKIKLGIKIRDELFDANPYSQIASIMEVLWALDVKVNSNLFTEEQITQADYILEQNRLLMQKIQELRNH